MNSTTCVIVVTYNGEPWIRRNLASLRASTIRPHVIVVDNASTDNTCTIIANEFPEVELIRLQENLGFGRGNNIGISRSIECGFSYSFLFNQDAYVTPTAVAELQAFLDANDEYGVISPLHCSPDLSSVDRKTMGTYLSRFAADYVSDVCLGLVRPFYRVRGVNAAAWMVRNTVLANVGGFDPLFFMYGEDDDLINRFAHHKVPFALLPSSRIVHLRASVVPSRISVLARFKQAVSRKRSSLLVEIKRPHFSIAHSILYVTLNGFARPALSFLVNRDTIGLLGSWGATVSIALESRTIRRHISECARTGPHFLRLQNRQTPKPPALEEAGAYRIDLTGERGEISQEAAPPEARSDTAQTFSGRSCLHLSHSERQK